MKAPSPCVRKFLAALLNSVTLNLVSRKLWLVVLAAWWSWADLWAMTGCLHAFETPEQINGFVELGKQHRILMGTIVIGYLAANTVIKKFESEP